MSAHTPIAHHFICLVDDGKLGSLRQIEALQRILNVKNSPIFTVYAPQSKILQAFCRIYPCCRFKTDSALPTQMPLYILCSGTFSCRQALYFKFRNPQIQIIAILNPRIYHRFFYRIIVPHHDGLKGKNIIPVVGACTDGVPCFNEMHHHYFFQKMLCMPQPRLAVMLGGNNRDNQWSDQFCTQIASDIIQWQKHTKGSVFITISHRTPQNMLHVLASLKTYAHIVIDFQSTYEIYQILSHHADAMLITEDSFSMIAELVHTQSHAPLYIYPCNKARPKTRLFLKYLYAHEHARPFIPFMPQYNRISLDQVEEIRQKCT